MTVEHDILESVSHLSQNREVRRLAKRRIAALEDPQGGVPRRGSCRQTISEQNARARALVSAERVDERGARILLDNLIASGIANAETHFIYAALCARGLSGASRRMADLGNPLVEHLSEAIRLDPTNNSYVDYAERMLKLLHGERIEAELAQAIARAR